MKHNKIKNGYCAKNVPLQKLTPYLFIFPALLLLVALVVYPLFYGAGISLFDTDLGDKWNFVGIGNYAEVFSDKVFLKQILLTLKFTILVVASHFVIGILLGTLLNQKKKGIGIFKVILILPWLFPDVVVALIFKWIFNPIYGLLNSYLQRWGIIEQGISWLGDSTYAFIMVVAVAIWKGFPLVMINVLAALQSVPEDIYEAAKIDGANKRQTLFSIVLPSIKPVLSATLILDTIWWFKHYTIVALLTGGGPGSDTSIISLEIYKQAFSYFDFGKAAAMSVVVFLICVLISKLYRRFLENED